MVRTHGGPPPRDTQHALTLPPEHHTFELKLRAAQRPRRGDGGKMATIRIIHDHRWNSRAADGGLHPWQQSALGSGLMLHAPLDLPVALAALQSDFAALDGSLGDDGRSFMTLDGSWSSITLVQRPATPTIGPGRSTPALEAMPHVRGLHAQAGWVVVSCHLMRLPPHGMLPWHFEAQAPHLAESRLLVPLHAPQGAVTLIGDEVAAYPEGTAWAGDFNFPHQVENHSDTQRIVLVIDVVSDPALRKMLSPALCDALPLRRALAAQACNALLAARAGGPVPSTAAA